MKFFQSACFFSIFVVLLHVMCPPLCAVTSFFLGGLTAFWPVYLAYRYFFRVSISRLNAPVVSMPKRITTRLYQSFGIKLVSIAICMCVAFKWLAVSPVAYMTAWLAMQAVVTLVLAAICLPIFKGLHFWRYIGGGWFGK